MSRSRLRGPDLLVVAAGGAVGSLARFGIDAAAPDTLFPWPTLLVNVVGALLLGLLPALAVVRRSRAVAIALGPGVLGGFTTVSAWAGGVRDLAAAGHVTTAGLYLAATLVAGLGAAAVGRRLSSRPGPRDRVA